MHFNHPPPTAPSSVTQQLVGYYEVGDIETINIIRAKLTEEQFIGFLRGNILKYMCRAGYKEGSLATEDYEKARYYTEELTLFTKK